MAEKILEKQFCRTCEADVRPGALFCYSCGSSVAPELLDEGNSTGERTAKLESNGNKYKNKESYSFENVEAAPAPIGKPVEKPLPEPTGEKIGVKDKKLVVQKETKLKTAAALRQNPKSLKRETVEVVWEAPETSKTVWFVVAAVILMLFAVGILMAMLYLR